PTPTPCSPAPFSSPCSSAHPDLPSFPTRRSSDLTAASRYEDNLAVNKAVADVKDSVRIIPTPKSMNVKRGTTTLNDQWTITFAGDRKSTRLNSSHVKISYAVFCLKKKKNT